MKILWKNTLTLSKGGNPSGMALYADSYGLRNITAEAKDNGTSSGTSIPAPNGHIHQNRFNIVAFDGHVTSRSREVMIMATIYDPDPYNGDFNSFLFIPDEQ